MNNRVKTYFDETNIISIISETLSANVHIVFTDDCVTITTNTATVNLKCWYDHVFFKKLMEEGYLYVTIFLILYRIVLDGYCKQKRVSSS